MLSLREAIANVIDNALRHGARARLDVHVRRREGLGVVEVLDDGPGIKAADWPEAVSRFYSRRPDSEGASGLGFAIASEVASTLGGKLRFRERTDTELFCVAIELPLVDKS